MDSVAPQSSTERVRPTFHNLIESGTILDVGKYLSKWERVCLCLASKPVAAIFRSKLRHIMWGHIVLNPQDEREAFRLLTNIHKCCDDLTSVQKISIRFFGLSPIEPSDYGSQPPTRIHAIYGRLQHILGRAPLETVKSLHYEASKTRSLTALKIFGQNHNLTGVEEISMMSGSEDVLRLFPNTKRIILRGRYEDDSHLGRRKLNPLPDRGGLIHERDLTWLRRQQLLNSDYLAERPDHNLSPTPIFNVIDTIASMNGVSSLKMVVPVPLRRFLRHFSTIPLAQLQQISALSITTHEDNIPMAGDHTQPLLTFLHKLTSLRELQLPQMIFDQDMGYLVAVRAQGDYFTNLSRMYQRAFIRTCHWFKCVSPALTTLTLGRRRKVVFEQTKDDLERNVVCMREAQTDDGDPMVSYAGVRLSFDGNVSVRFLIAEHDDLAGLALHNNEQWERAFLIPAPSVVETSSIAMESS